MRPLLARGIAVALLLVACGVGVWLATRVLRSPGTYPGQLREVAFVSLWPFLALPFALWGRPDAVFAVLLPYAVLSALFGLSYGGPHYTLGIPAHLLAVAVGFRDASIVRSPRWPGYALATFAMGIGALVIALTYTCGASVTNEVAPGEPPAPAQCVSRVHPIGVVIVGLAVASFAALALGFPHVPIVAGALLSAAGVPLVFSAGVFAWVAGFALLAAGSAAWTAPGGRRRRDAGASS